MFGSTPPSLPAACADCIETTRLALPGLAPVENALQQFRSLEGKLRFNFGTMSLISNPLAALRILLNHATLEARILNPPPIPGMPAVPGMPGIPAIPGLNIPQVGLEIAAAAALGMKMEQLGKALIDGHEVQGMRYLFDAAAALSLWEVWTSTKLALPVLTKTIGSFGERICLCKCAAVQPAPSLFEIPPGYKIIES